MKTAIVGCGALVTLAGPRGPRTGADLGTLADGAMLIEGGVIRSVGTRSEIEAAIDKDTEVVDVGGRLVLPGLVDAHTHPVFGGGRADEFVRRCQGCSYSEIAAEGGGILATVKATRRASEEELLESARRRLGWFLAHGTTTLEAKSGYGLDHETELMMLRVIRRLAEEGPTDLVPTYLGLHAVPAGKTASRYAEEIIEETLPVVASEGLAEYADAFLEPGYFDADSVERVLSGARRLGLGLRLHADQLTCSGGAQLAARLGATTADHLEQTEGDGIAALASAGVQPVLLPGSVFGLGHSRYPDARSMIDAGLAVVLATDFNPGSSPTVSLPMVMAIACRYMAMTPEEAIVACTISAAHSLGRSHDRGTLEPGKRADFVVFDADDPREVPYWFGTNIVLQTWIGGRRY